MLRTALRPLARSLPRQIQIQVPSRALTSGSAGSSSSSTFSGKVVLASTTLALAGYALGVSQRSPTMNESAPKSSDPKPSVRTSVLDQPSLKEPIHKRDGEFISYSFAALHPGWMDGSVIRTDFEDHRTGISLQQTPSGPQSSEIMKAYQANRVELKHRRRKDKLGNSLYRAAEIRRSTRDRRCSGRFQRGNGRDQLGLPSE